MQYNISYEKNNVYQAILINAQSDVQAVSWFEQHNSSANVIGCKIATADDQRPGKPVLTVPDNYCVDPEELEFSRGR